MSLPLQSPNFDHELRVLSALEKEWERRKSRNRLADYRPYAKQLEFHALGLTKRERLFLAGNQLGKTVAGAFETAIHATGKYPEWWTGRRFNRPVIAWVAGVTGESTRDNPQRLLMGRPGEWGTGAIPGDDIIGHSRASHGVTDLLDTIRVRHVSGGSSSIAIKFYEKGRERWQGETIDFAWEDEEPQPDIYSEGLTRTNATGGMVFLTCTPLLGMTEVIRRFLQGNSPDRGVTRMTIDDAEHYTKEERERIIRSYPAHEQEARVNGIPMLGSGRVFPIVEEAIREQQVQVPDHWARIVGLDIGWDHPTAAVWMAHDRDTDTVHVTDCYRVREETPVVHSAAIMARGKWIPVAWPHDGLQHDKGSGVELAQQYKNQGVAMLGERATFDDGSNGVEAGVIKMLDRMKTGRLKVAAHLNDWWEEFRLYHRKDGVLVKEADDLMSATRYGLMMLRHAAAKPQPVQLVNNERVAGGWMR